MINAVESHRCQIEEFLILILSLLLIMGGEILGNSFSNVHASSTQIYIPGHSKYLDIRNNVAVHSSQYFTRKNWIGVLRKRTAPTIQIRRIFKVGSRIRYEVYLRNKLGYGFVTSNPYYISNAYWGVHDLRPNQSTLARLTSSAWVYNSTDFTHKHRLYMMPGGTYLKVNGIAYDGLYGQSPSRLVLDGSHYVTGNRYCVALFQDTSII